MRQNLDRQLARRFPGFYNWHLLVEKAEQLGWSQRETARKAKVNAHTIKKIFKGKANNTKVYAVATVLGVDWLLLHDIELMRTHLAVAKNGRKAAAE